MDAKDIQAARAAIGPSASGDWRITPTRHPEDLATTAPELVAVLERSAAMAVASGYEKLDRDADDRQRRFKRTSALANAAVLAATTMGAASAVAASVHAAGMRRWIVLAIALLGATASAVAAAALHWLRSGKLLERWMSSRARAEACRLKYFDEITSAPSDRFTGLLQLEYFRRYQLGVQRAYFEGRGRQHDRAARKTQIVAVAGIAAATFANVFVSAKAIEQVQSPPAVTAPQTGAGVASAATAPAPRGSVDYLAGALSILAVFGAALSAFSVAREESSQDARNAERYDRMAEVLRDFESRLDDVRQSVAGNDRHVMAQFVRSIHQELAVEQRAWLDQASRQESALAALDAAIQARKGQTGGQPNTGAAAPSGTAAGGQAKTDDVPPAPAGKDQPG